MKSVGKCLSGMDIRKAGVAGKLALCRQKLRYLA